MFGYKSEACSSVLIRLLWPPPRGSKAATGGVRVLFGTPEAQGLHRAPAAYPPRRRAAQRVPFSCAGRSWPPTPGSWRGSCTACRATTRWGSPSVAPAAGPSRGAWWTPWASSGTWRWVPWPGPSHARGSGAPARLGDAEGHVWTSWKTKNTDSPRLCGLQVARQAVLSVPRSLRQEVSWSSPETRPHVHLCPHSVLSSLGLRMHYRVTCGPNDISTPGCQGSPLSYFSFGVLLHCVNKTRQSKYDLTQFLSAFCLCQVWETVSRTSPLREEGPGVLWNPLQPGSDGARGLLRTRVWAWASQYLSTGRALRKCTLGSSDCFLTFHLENHFRLAERL